MGGSASSIALLSFSSLSRLCWERKAPEERLVEAARVTSRMVPPQQQPIAEGGAAAVPLRQPRSLSGNVPAGKGSLLLHPATPPPLSPLPTARTRAHRAQLRRKNNVLYSKISVCDCQSAGRGSHPALLLLLGESALFI